MIKRALAAASLLCLCSMQLYGQSPEATDSHMQKILEYYRCVKNYSSRLAKTPELPNDIATAALEFCGPFLTNGIPPPWDDYEKHARRIAVLTVLESRYPASK